MSLISNISWRSIALWKRNRDVFLTTWKTNFVPPFLEPILYLLAMGLGFGALIPEDIVYRGMSVEYIKFLAPGLIAISVMYGAFFECTYSSFVRMYYQKTFDAIMATPLSLEDIIAGEILWGATKSFINATIVLAVVAVLGYAELPLLLIIPAIAFLGGLMFASLAMLFTALVPNMDSFNYPFFLFITPMFLFSGTFFPLSVLPVWGQQLALALPLTHISNMVRDLSYSMATMDVALGFVYLAALTALCFLASVFLMKRRLVK
ncbi:MAG: ABC-2 type transporter [Methanomassiliicoccales archaeon PtaB.Bin134]|nr:MAG: ABC-2 type transporter [Methanomassiliicoccales archaeon PtaB.Bin134]